MTKYERLSIPEVLLAPCRKPDLGDLATNAALENALAESLVFLSDCSADKATIKALSDRGSPGP